MELMSHHYTLTTQHLCCTNNRYVCAYIGPGKWLPFNSTPTQSLTWWHVYIRHKWNNVTLYAVHIRISEVLTYNQEAWMVQWETISSHMRTYVHAYAQKYSYSRYTRTDTCSKRTTLVYCYTPHPHHSLYIFLHQEETGPHAAFLLQQPQVGLWLLRHWMQPVSWQT